MQNVENQGLTGKNFLVDDTHLMSRCNGFNFVFTRLVRQRLVNLYSDGFTGLNLVADEYLHLISPSDFFQRNITNKKHVCLNDHFSVCISSLVTPGKMYF